MVDNNSDNYNSFRRIDELEQKEVALLKMDTNLAEIIIKSTKQTFKSCFSIDIDSSPPVKTNGNQIVADYTGIIGMLQASIEARISITFATATLVDILKQVYPDSASATEEIMKDAVEEILNMIYGTVKTELNKSGYQFKMTIPTVIAGAKHTLHQLHNGVNLTLPFNYKQHKFFINVTLQKTIS